LTIKNYYKDYFRYHSEKADERVRQVNDQVLVVPKKSEVQASLF